MAPNMNTIDNKWVAYNRRTHYTNPPSITKLAYNWTSHSNMQRDVVKHNFAEGGIYLRDDVDVNQFLDYNRKKINDGIILTMQLPQITNRDSISASDMFNRKDLYESWRKKLLGPVISFVAGLGQAFSIGLGSYAIYLFLYNVFKHLQAATVLYAIYGCSRQICQMFCLRSTLLMEMKRHRRYSRAATNDPNDIELRTLNGSVHSQPARLRTREPPPEPRPSEHGHRSEGSDDPPN